MIRLRFPPVPPAEPPARLPPALRWDAPPVTVAVLLSRRELLRAIGVLLAAAAVPWTRAERAVAAARGRFFTRPERQTLEALCDRIIPPDADPGGAALGAARYIESLLTALDRPRRPLVYAGGPFSGRQPFNNPRTGTPSRRRPRNGFRKFLPLPRLKEIAWHAELFGSASVPEMAAVDQSLGSTKEGLRDKYRAALAKVDQVAQATAGHRFVELAPLQQDAVLALLDQGAFPPDPRRGGRTWPTLLILHTLEGCFGAPEYGGNRRTAGWRMVGHEGDSQPLGYALWSDALGDYVERPDHPLSTPDPDEIGPGGAIVPRPLNPDAQRIQNSILTLTTPFASGELC